MLDHQYHSLTELISNKPRKRSSGGNARGYYEDRVYTVVYSHLQLHYVPPRQQYIEQLSIKTAGNLSATADCIKYEIKRQIM